jgi:hypothetical protein
MRRLLKVASDFASDTKISPGVGGLLLEDLIEVPDTFPMNIDEILSVVQLKSASALSMRRSAFILS